MLSPLLFNILVDDLFFHVKRAKLNGYADDQVGIQPSNVDSVALEPCVCYDVDELLMSGTMRMRDVTVDDSKHQALDLSDTDNGHR